MEWFIISAKLLNLQISFENLVDLKILFAFPVLIDEKRLVVSFILIYIRLTNI